MFLNLKSMQYTVNIYNYAITYNTHNATGTFFFIYNTFVLYIFVIEFPGLIYSQTQ